MHAGTVYTSLKQILRAERAPVWGRRDGSPIAYISGGELVALMSVTATAPPPRSMSLATLTLPARRALSPSTWQWLWSLGQWGALQYQASRRWRGSWNAVLCLQEEGVLTCSLSRVTPCRLEYMASEERYLFHSLISPQHTDECWQHSRYLININGINIHGSKSREKWKCSCLSGKDLAMIYRSGPY